MFEEQSTDKYDDCLWATVNIVGEKKILPRDVSKGITSAHVSLSQKVFNMITKQEYWKYFTMPNTFSRDTKVYAPVVHNDDDNDEIVIFVYDSTSNQTLYQQLEKLVDSRARNWERI